MDFTTPGSRADFCTAAALPAPEAASARCPGQYPADPESASVRNYLRGHPDDAPWGDGALKKRLAALHDNGDDYTRAKTEFVQELTDEARVERGLPPASRWED